MQIHVGLAIVAGVPADKLDDAAEMRACLERAVAAADFALYDVSVVKFPHQGVTAAAVVGESHVALHSWPEHGRLFVDVASCRDEAGVRRALASVVEGFPGARVLEQTLHAMGGPR